MNIQYDLINQDIVIIFDFTYNKGLCNCPATIVYYRPFRQNSNITVLDEIDIS